jgi:hypothetical protein
MTARPHGNGILANPAETPAARRFLTAFTDQTYLA